MTKKLVQKFLFEYMVVLKGFSTDYRAGTYSYDIICPCIWYAIYPNILGWWRSPLGITKVNNKLFEYFRVELAFRLCLNYLLGYHLVVRLCFYRKKGLNRQFIDVAVLFRFVICVLPEIHLIKYSFL